MLWQSKLLEFGIGDKVQYRTESQNFIGKVIGFEAAPSRRICVDWDNKDMILPQYTDRSNLAKIEQPPPITEIINLPGRPPIRSR